MKDVRVEELLEKMQETGDVVVDTDLEHIVKIVENDLLEKIGDFIGGGSCGMVYKILGSYNVKKYFKPKDPEKDLYIKDEEILKDLQGSTLYPKLYFSKPGEYIIKEHIEGFTFENINKAISECKTNLDLINIYHNLMPQLQNLYDFTVSKGYYPIDLEDDNVVIREDGSICVIDVGLFERFELRDKNSKYYVTKKEHNKRLKYIREHISELSSSILVKIIFTYSAQNINQFEIMDMIKNKKAV